MARPNPNLHWSQSVDADESRGGWLSSFAFILSLAIVITRVTILETTRDPFSVGLGSQAIPRGAGAAAGVVLDFLSYLPLLSILLRRVLDRTHRPRLPLSPWIAAALAACALASIAWSADKFVAAVGAFHFASAVAIFLAMAMVVTTHARLRLTAAIAFGLLLVCGTQGLYYRFVDLPDLQRSFAQNKDSILKERGWEPGSFQAEQFSRKITGGEMIGFNASPNTFAAVIVLTSLIALGLLAQRRADDDDPAFALAYLPAIAIGTYIIYCTHGKGAMASLAIGVVAMSALFFLPPFARWLTTHAKRAYFLGVTLSLLAIAAVITHGLYHHSLPTDSLNFRWRYWVGSAHLFTQHSLLGVGWNNFGAHYLATRLPAAAEEIKDPHNFLLKFFLELGAVGGLLSLAWLARLAWDATQPASPAIPDAGLASSSSAPTLPYADRTTPDATRSPLPYVAFIACLGLLLNTLASLDLTEQPAYVVVELFKRGLFLCVLLLGAALVALRRLDQSHLDQRPAPWILCATLVGLALFLLQSLIDVAFFEVGPMFLFFALAGATLGIRQPAPSSPAKPRASALGLLLLTTLAWLTSLTLLVIPIIKSEYLATLGDDAMRASHPDRAAAQYADAADALPWNAEYAFRAARAAISAGQTDMALTFLTRAIAHDPTNIEYYLTRAQLRSQLPHPNPAEIKADYEKVLELNPNDLSIRIAYADLLTRYHLPAEARAQYQIALDKNELLDLTEPKRLSPADLARLRAATTH